MTTALQMPTPANVRAACQQYDRENELVEQTLSELFQQHTLNSDLRHVLLKVVAVNALHHTMILAVEAVARHIHQHHHEIDAALSAGSPEVVDLIARLKVNGKPHNFFSFATKYCSGHNPSAYPVYDAHVDHNLWAIQKEDHFAAFHHPDLWSYPKFLKIMTDFRNFHGLDGFSFKEIDKFLFLEASPNRVATADIAPQGLGAFDFYPAGEELSESYAPRIQT